MMKLQQAKEQNDRLDVENRALRERVRTLESEKNNLLDQVGVLQIFFIRIKNKCCQSSLALFGLVFVQSADQDVVAKEDQKDQSISSDPPNSQFGSEKDYIHKR